jgi:hypothetical protein
MKPTAQSLRWLGGSLLVVAVAAASFAFADEAAELELVQGIKAEAFMAPDGQNNLS